MLLFIPEAVTGSFEEKVKQLNHIRQARSCVEGALAAAADNESEGHPFLDSLLPFPFLIQIGIIGSGILVIVLLLGLLKGIVGVFLYPPMGMLGLGYLIDLPKELNKYQESELAQMKVVYDSVGWPIHPQTGRRTVRAVTIKTEFCVNVIFFIALPIVILVTVISACFTHKTYDEDDGGECYQKVNTIMLSDTPSLKLLAKGCTDKGARLTSTKSGPNQPCPTKGRGASAGGKGCDKSCKHLKTSKTTSSSTPTPPTKSKSSSSGTKSAMKPKGKSPKSSTSSKSASSKSGGKKSSGKGKAKPAKGKAKPGGKKPAAKAPVKKKGTSKSKSDDSVYKDDDSNEDADTQYVLDQMRESEMSLSQNSILNM